MAQSLDSSAGIPSEPVTSVAARVARRTSLWRDLVTWTLIVLTYLSLVLTVLCLWTRGFLFNTDRFVGVVAPIIRNGGVADALSIRASEQIVSALQIQQRAESALPERASFLAGPLAKAPTDTVADRLDDLLRNNRFACVWEEALRIVHSQLIVVLRDRSNALRLNGDTVRLSLFPVIDYGFGVVEEVGLLPDRLPRPDLANVTPEQGRQLLSSVFGVQLPPDVGEVTVAESESLHNAQQWVRIFRIVTVVALPLLMLALAGAAIWVAHSRRRALIQLAIGGAVALLLARFVIDLLGQRFFDALSENPTSFAVAQDAFRRLFESFTSFITIVVAVCLAVASVSFLVGRRSWSESAWDRGRAATALTRPGTPATRWVSGHADLLRMAVVAVALVALFLVDLSWAWLFLIAGLLILYQLALQVLAGRGGAESAASARAG